MNRGHQTTLDWFSERLNMTEFLSILSGFGLIYVELDNRKPPRQALAEALSRPLPSFASWPRILGLSVVVLVAVALIDIRLWLRFAYVIYAGVFGLLVLVPLVGVRAMGAQRWLDFGLRFQPSDLSRGCCRTSTS